MDFYWKYKDGGWLLRPSSISVAKVDGYWRILIEGPGYQAPLHLPYTSEQGAKLDAWEFATSKSKVLFGTSCIRLVDAPIAPSSEASVSDATPLSYACRP
jgi:hypothetical protein